jgi:hypothetical protein
LDQGDEVGSGFYAFDFGVWDSGHGWEWILEIGYWRLGESGLAAMAAKMSVIR